MRTLPLLLTSIAVLTGCSAHKNAAIIDGQSRGKVGHAQMIAQRSEWSLTPTTQSTNAESIHLQVRYASSEFLNEFFSSPEIFGELAGKNPFYGEHLVFYVRFMNQSNKRIHFDANKIALVDDLGNQYHPLSVDDITSYTEKRKPISSFTRDTISDVSPGYMGFNFPIGKIFAAKPQGPFALLKQSMLEQGTLYPGVIYDGLIAFWNPATLASKVTLVIPDIATDFGPDQYARTAHHLNFEFSKIPSIGVLHPKVVTTKSEPHLRGMRTELIRATSEDLKPSLTPTPPTPAAVPLAPQN